MSDIIVLPPIPHRSRPSRLPINVTPDIVLDVVRLIYETYLDEDAPSWPEFLRRARRDNYLWRQYLNGLVLDPDEDLSTFGDNAEKVRAVLKIAAVVLAPPEDDAS